MYSDALATELNYSALLYLFLVDIQIINSHAGAIAKIQRVLKKRGKPFSAIGK